MGASIEGLKWTFDIPDRLGNLNLSSGNVTVSPSAKDHFRSQVLKMALYCWLLHKFRVVLDNFSTTNHHNFAKITSCGDTEKGLL